MQLTVTTTMNGTEQDLRAELVMICKEMSRRGLSKGTSGNVSVRFGDDLLISPTGIAYDSLQPDQVVRMHADGCFDGDILPSSEWRFHKAILDDRPELNAVVHTHSTCATAVSILEKDIPAIHYQIASAGGSTIRCASYATFGTEELAAAILTGMRDRRACLLAHHGAIAAHVSLPKALALAETLEELARLYLLCLPLGPPPVLPDEEIVRVLAKFRTYGQQPKVPA
jgi:L-fuculose-phosphate aldolase